MSKYVKSVFYTIPYYDNFGINTNGEVIDKQTGSMVKRFICHDQLCVDLEGEIKQVALLMLSTFVGPLPGTIYFKDDDPMNCRTDNIGLLLNIQWENPDLADSDVIINGQRFKLAAHYDSRYYLSEYGVLFDRNYGIRPHSFSQREYWSVVITEGWDNRNKRMISRWVYETWIGPIPENHEIDHKDAKHWHNHISNLEAVTSIENMRRSYDEQCVRTRVWSKDQARQVCEMMSKNLSISEMLEKLNLSKDWYSKLSRLTQDIKANRYHREISKDYDLSGYQSVSNTSTEGNRSLTLEDVRTVLKLSKQGMSNNEIAKQLNTTHSVVYGIVCGRSYKSYLKKLESELI